MEASEFKNMDINDRANLVWANGEFVGHRDYYGYRIALYVLPKLFVEVWIFQATNKIEKVEPLENEKSLDQYVNGTDLIKLFNQE